MPRKPDIMKFKKKALSQLGSAVRRYQRCRQEQLNYSILRWIASMTAVEVFAIWERYAERRLTLALVYHPEKFIEENAIRGLKSISTGLSAVLVRKGNRYFDFRSMSDLIDKSDHLLGRNENPFRKISPEAKNYLDTLGAIRNYIVHQSDSALSTYKRYLSNVYRTKSKPEPDEFLNSIDYRSGSPARHKPRLLGLISIVEDVIRNS